MRVGRWRNEREEEGKGWKRHEEKRSKEKEAKMKEGMG